MDLKEEKRKIKIGVLMGGLSPEREVSLKTGAAIHRSLVRQGYNACRIDAGTDLAEALKREGAGAAFIALHGGAGEDGSVQGLLEVMGIPYTGSGVLASALAMDKEYSKRIFHDRGILVPEGTVLAKPDYVFNPDMPRDMARAIGFGFPWVVKPATAGSSIGVSMVREPDGIRAALDGAFALSDRVIVERRIIGREVQVGILGGRVLGSVEVRPLKTLDFYNYDAKYAGGLTEYILPPEVDEKALSLAHETGLAAHLALGCRGATRVDLIVDAEGHAHVLEVNTIPGMTETSLLPKIAKAGGLDFDALVEEMLKEAFSG